MNKWMKVFLAAILVAGLVAGLGGVMPTQAAPGDVVAYRVNAGGATVAATDGGPAWSEDRVTPQQSGGQGSQWDNDCGQQAGTPSSYLTGNTDRSGCIENGDIGSAIGGVPTKVFQSYRYARDPQGATPRRTLSYAFPVTQGREYTINLYFAVPNWMDVRFDVRVDGTTPSGFNNIVLPDRYVPTMRTATVTAVDNSLDLLWIYDDEDPQVNAIEIIELALVDNTAPTVAITAPADGALLNGTETLIATASDDVGVTQVEFYHGTTLIGTDTNIADGWSVSWDTTAVDDGAYSLTATASDAAGNEGTSAAVNVTVDNTAPVVSITAPTDGATVSGDVDVTVTTSPDTVSVAYYLDGVLIGNGGATFAILWNSTTAADGSHTLKAVATDGAGLTDEDEITVVVDNNAAPVVSITDPAGGTVSGTRTITAAASDDGTVTKVEFFVDGTKVGEDIDTAGGWTFNWDSTSVADGLHSLTATATDDGGKTGTSAAISVTVNNNTAPVVAITSPAEGEVLSGTETLTATAADPDGIQGVAFFFGPYHIATDIDGSDGWSVLWDTTLRLDGPYVLTAQARDNLGLDGASAPVNVTIDNNAAPVVTITDPTGGTVTATTTITANATDDGTVTKVEFFVNGTKVGEDTDASGGWTFDWDTTVHADGPHSLTAVATDDGGKTGTSAAVNVTVDNNAAPTVSITSPTGGTVSGLVTIEALPTDDGMVTQVEFFVDGVSAGVDTDGSDGWSVSWDTTALADADYTLTATATDAGGKTGTSAPVTVTVDNVPAVISITAPASGATVAGLLSITASTSDDVTFLEFFVDGVLIGAGTPGGGAAGGASHWAIQWDTTLVEDGEHTLQAVGMTDHEVVVESQSQIVIVQNTDEPTPTGPEVQPGMLCNLEDGSLNAEHCGRPVAIFRTGADLHLYGVDINTGNGMLAMTVTEATIAEAGEPADVPVVIAVGENPYTHRPIALYRLPGGEFQLNTLYWDGKEYIVKWRPDAEHVDVVVW